MKGDIKLGASLFSFGYEDAKIKSAVEDSGRYPKDCEIQMSSWKHDIALIHQFGYEGIELALAPMLDSYPLLGKIWLENMKQWLKDGHFGTLVYGCYPEMMAMNKSYARQIALHEAKTPAPGETPPLGETPAPGETLPLGETPASGEAPPLVAPCAASGSAAIYYGLCRDMDIAKKLGCGLVRVQGRIPRELWEPLADEAGRRGLWIGMDFIYTDHLSEPFWQDYIDFLEKGNGNTMGIVPEGNIFLTEPTESFYIEWLEKGISDAAYIMALDCFAGRGKMRAGELEQLPEAVRFCFEDMCRCFAGKNAQELRVLTKLARCVEYHFSALHRNCRAAEELASCLEELDFKGCLIASYEGYFGKREEQKDCREPLMLWAKEMEKFLNRKRNSV